MEEFFEIEGESCTDSGIELEVCSDSGIEVEGVLNAVPIFVYEQYDKLLDKNGHYSYSLYS